MNEQKPKDVPKRAKRRQGLGLHPQRNPRGKAGRHRGVAASQGGAACYVLMTSGAALSGMTRK